MSSHISDPKLQASKKDSTNTTGRENAIAAAYNVIAADYDSQLESVQWIRERLWKRLDVLFPAKSHVLDVTAGTGLDVLHLIERDVSVVASDISAKMLHRLHKRNPDVKAVVSDFNRPGMTAKFDGIISTFAGLNTSSDLRSFAEQAARLLRRDGTLFIHVLNRWPLSDIARRTIKFQWLDAWSTIKTNPRNVNIGDLLVPHYLYSPKSLYRSVFAQDFRLSRIEGQGFVRPLNAEWGHQLDILERRLASRFPFYSMGIFFSLELTRV